MDAPSRSAMQLSESLLLHWRHWMEHLLSVLERHGGRAGEMHRPIGHSCIRQLCSCQCSCDGHERLQEHRHTARRLIRRCERAGTTASASAAPRASDGASTNRHRRAKTALQLTRGIHQPGARLGTRVRARFTLDLERRPHWGIYKTRLVMKRYSHLQANAHIWPGGRRRCEVKRIRKP